MASPKKWSGVAIALYTMGASQAITGITKAAPGVATTSGTAPVNGDLLYFEVSGMTEINRQILRAKSVSGLTFQLEAVDGTSIDTTNFTTFTSGSFKKLTAAYSVSSATTINSSGGDISQIPTTTVHDTQETSIPGLPSAKSYGMDHIWDPTDTAQQALLAYYKSQSLIGVGFTFGTGGPKMYFAGYSGFDGTPSGQAQGLVTTNGVFNVFGFPTYYAS